MKLLIVLCFVALVGLTLAKPPKRSYPRGCVSVYGECIRECEEGSLASLIGCERRKPPATCDNPDPQPERGNRVCDYTAITACYCNPPTVRDTLTGKCVPLDECYREE